MSEVTDLIGLAINKNPVDFASAFNDIIQQKQSAALEAHKIELAQSMYEPVENNVDTIDELDFQEDDFEDMDDEDLDEIDLEDLDLDDIDLDLEGIEDEDD